MELIIYVIIAAISAAISYFVTVKLNSAKFDIYIEQAKAKAKVIEHEAEVILKDAQLRAKADYEREFKEAKKELKIPVIAEPELGRDWFHVDTRYWREKNNGEIELVSAFKVEDLKAARDHLRLGDSEPLVVLSGKKSLPVSVGDVIIHSLYGDTSVVSGAKFDAMFKEVV